MIHREAGLRFAIYVDDHNPPHVHVIGTLREMKVFPFGPDSRPSIDNCGAMKTNDRKRAMAVIELHRAEFHVCWRLIHGS